MRLSFNRTSVLKSLAYSAFFSFAFAAMLYLTFPYSILIGKVKSALVTQGYDVTIGSIGPSITGPKAKNVTLLFPQKPGVPERTAFMIPAVSARPMLIPPGIALRVELPGGTVHGGWRLVGGRQLTLEAKKLDLAKSNLKEAIGLDLTGSLNFLVDLKLDPASTAKTTGRIALNGDSLLIAGGTVSNFDLPRIELGRLEGDIQLTGGKAEFKTFRTIGGDAELNVEGDIALADKLLMSTLRLKLKFKPKEEFLKKNALIAGGLNLAMSKDPQGFYAVGIERALGNPSFRPLK